MKNCNFGRKIKEMRYFLILCVVLLTLSGCENRATWRTADGAVWATTYHITYLADSELHDSIIAVMAQVEQSLSPFDSESLVSKINRGETDRVDAYFTKVFERSSEISAKSGGKFDPTVAPAVNLWRFGYRDSGREPLPDEIDSVVAIVGMNDCRIDSGHVVRKSPLTEFDFSAITKGLGCDEVGRMLERNGCSDYMVEIGGEIALSGKNRRGESWRIMIDAPVENDTAVVHERLAVVALTDCGIATSGNYRNYRDTGEGRIGHTIDPLTCRPVKTRTLSATVTAPDAMTADALATACMAMEAAEAINMIRVRESTEAMIVVADSLSRMRILTTPGFPTL